MNDTRRSRDAARRIPSSRLIVACGLAVLGAATTITPSCHPPPDPWFQCGVGLDSDPKIVRVCDGPHQACICATNACATAVATAVCPSGFRYLDPPFRPSDMGGYADPDGGNSGGGSAASDVYCVPAIIASWRVAGDAEDPKCSDAGGGGTGGSGGGTSTSTSASGGSGGGTTSSGSTGGTK